jgi:CBS domain-containing protein
MKKRVRDVMSAPAFTVSEFTPLKVVVELMHEHRVSAVPVIDAAGKLVGLVSEADVIVREHYPRSGKGGTIVGVPGDVERRKATATVAAQLMTSAVVAIRPDASLRAAATAMRENAVKRLPVVDQAGIVVGIVSRSDLLKIFLRADDEIRTEIEREVLDGAMWLARDAVRVEVHDGEVSLVGDVERCSDADAIAGLVHGVDGVVDVHSYVKYRIDDRPPTSGEARTPAGAAP